MHETWVFLVQVGFKVHRGMIAEGAVEPLAVVKHFDPFKDGGPGFGPRGELTAMHQFAFEAAPEAFHRRIVVAVAGPAHAGDDARLRQDLPVSRTGILSFKNPPAVVCHLAFPGKSGLKYKSASSPTPSFVRLKLGLSNAGIAVCDTGLCFVRLLTTL